MNTNIECTMIGAFEDFQCFWRLPKLDICSAVLHLIKMRQGTHSLEGNKDQSCVFCKSNPRSELTVYGKETTLHGLKYVFQTEQHLCEKIFWTISFVSGIVIAAFLIYGVCMSYLKNPVIVTYQVAETKISSIPFPAVTICNTNRVRKSMASDLMKSARKEVSRSLWSNKKLSNQVDEQLLLRLKQLKCVDYICENPPILGPIENNAENASSLYEELLSQFEGDRCDLPSEVDISAEDILEVRFLVKHPCDEFGIYCKWGNVEYNCSEFLSYLYTDEGICCVFNKIPAVSLNADLDHMYENAEKELSWGTDFSKLNSFFDVDAVARTLLKNVEKIRTQKRGGRSEGISIVLNPQLEDFYCSGFNEPGFVFKTHLPVDTPQILEHSTPIPPATEVFVSLTPSAIFADGDIKGFTVENRRCYFEGEFELKIFKTYTKDNCIVECEAEVIEEVCGCPLFYINLSGNKSCGPEDDICVDAAYKKMMKSPVSEQCPHCLSTCNELEYIENVITSPISPQNSKYHTGYPREFYKDWVNKRASILHVYFEDDSFYARERKQLNTLQDLIANIGGLLGLCLGFSGLSLVELGYFFCIRPCFRRQRKGNISPTVRQTGHFGSS